MQNDAVFINTCRGVVWNETRLITPLQADRLFGVGTDITEIEPIQPDNFLPAMPNILIMPQSVGHSMQALETTKPYGFASFQGIPS